MSVVIQVENLSKYYRLGRIGGHTLREDVSRWWAKTRGQPDPSLKIGTEDHGNRAGNALWALRDVSFEVREGDILGIIGRNGAGKSTLLKILSRITAPTIGRVKIKGRIGSLLEVGTGFHPELTGRENIYLNGAILGMKKAEIDRKLDEIIDFAEIERFIETPVKRYSSGMYVRLAFAVAAHLEPEILIVDEVLAVGDATFQKKCLGKMGDVAKHGRTVLFVSHNMAAVQHLCRQGIVLAGGRVQLIADQIEAVSAYLARLSPSSHLLETRSDRLGTGEVRVESLAIVDDAGREVDIAVSGQDVAIRLMFVKYRTQSFPRIVASIAVRTQLDVPVFLLHSRLTGQEFGNLPDQGYFELRIPRLPLPPGSYRMAYSLTQDDAYLDAIEDAAELSVIGGNFYGTGEVPPITHGVCLLDGKWSLTALP